MHGLREVTETIHECRVERLLTSTTIVGMAHLVHLSAIAYI